MNTENKKNLTQHDWDKASGLASLLQQERLLGKPVDLGSILDVQGFSRQIKDMHFANFSFHNFILDRLEFHDCNFSERDFRNTSLSNLQFIECNCIKVKLLDCILTDNTFSKCALSHSEIIHSEFQNVSIKNSMLRGSYWNHAKLSQLYIHNSILDESVFYSTSIYDSSLSCADLKNVFWIQNTGEFLKTKCSIASTNRPVVGMAWDFLQRGQFSPFIDDALRENGAILLKIEMQSISIDKSRLNEEIAECLSHSESASSIIARKLFCLTVCNPEIDKTEANAASLLDYCSALVLPGGDDIEPEFYTAEQPTSAKRDYRRSILEFALLTQAHQRKIPVLGICRGSQMINVYFGGTLKDLPESLVQKEWQYLALSNSSKKEELQKWIGGSNIWAVSMHHQACDNIGENLEVIIEHEGIPKLLMSHDSQFIGIQFHPEAYMAEYFIKDHPEAIHNKGFYQFFFSKVLQYQMLHV